LTTPDPVRPALEALTSKHFAPLMNQSFELREAGATLAFELIVAEALGGQARSGHNRQPFHLIFRGPPAPLLPQRIYALHHAAIGLLEIFLVPIGPDDRGQCYEAVFS
jgi:Domain of unknown function (DUF6916)